MKMKKIRNRIVFSLVSLLILSIMVNWTWPWKRKKQEESKTKIGISKIVAHPALDAVEKGLQEELTNQGFTDIEYDFQNANGEPATAKQIATKFKAEKVDIAVGIATPTAQALVNTIDDIPIVFSAVTDPEGAGLVESDEKGDPNVTGVSDMTPVETQAEMILQIKGDVKKIGNIYASGEANSVTINNLLKEACKKLGVEVVEATVTNSAEVKQAAESIINRVDAIYIGTDNTVVSALSAVTDVANKNGIPVVTADPSSAEKYDVLASYGFNYYQVGIVTGKLIAKILNGESTSNLPTVFMTDPSSLDLLVNKDVAKEIGIELPESVLEQANKIVEDGKVTAK